MALDVSRFVRSLYTNRVDSEIWSNSFTMPPPNNDQRVTTLRERPPSAQSQPATWTNLSGRSRPRPACLGAMQTFGRDSIDLALRRAIHSSVRLHSMTRLSTIQSRPASKKQLRCEGAGPRLVACAGKRYLGSVAGGGGRRHPDRVADHSDQTEWDQVKSDSDRAGSKSSHF